MKNLVIKAKIKLSSHLDNYLLHGLFHAKKISISIYTLFLFFFVLSTFLFGFFVVVIPTFTFTFPVRFQSLVLSDNNKEEQ